MFLRLFLVLLRSHVALSVIIPLQRRRDAHSTSVHVNTVAGDPYNFQNVNNSLYAGTIHVSGQPFLVQLDTGSSDLWLDTAEVSLSGTVNTGVYANISYADESTAQGNITLVDINFGDFTVKHQAFIDSPGSNATSNGATQGLMGVGPLSTSVIPDFLNRSGSAVNGSPFLFNVFNLYPNEPNYITFLLSRGGQFGTVDGGDFTIGEFVNNLSTIADAPKLPVTNPAAWVTWMSGVTVNGKQINYTAPSADGLPAILDSGSTLGNVPVDVLHAIYGDLPGAVFDNDTSFYNISCDTKMNISFIFGGIEYPIHPLDAVYVPGDIVENGSPVCFSALYASEGPIALLGDMFLRNVYSLYDFGNWTEAGDAGPFMQLLSVLDQDEAWAEFDSLNHGRLQQALAQINKSDQITTPKTTDNPPPTQDIFGALSDNSVSSSSVDLSGLTRNMYIIVGLIAAVVLLLIVLVLATLLKGRGGDGKGSYSVVGLYGSTDRKEQKPLSLATERFSAESTTPYNDGGR
ncbi:unnamed protein product [Somion occarium]|uniref:Peptidase A1 domain-containing protein n=1 Tax=Somion occarium TaxID=3059160 RepID=A0ABP1D3K0_9APHY